MLVILISNEAGALPMRNSDKKITGILLAGGLSRRMGREKGLIRLGDRYLFQYPLNVLESVCDEILISSCKGPLPGISHPVVCDEVKGIGPLGGIHACLRRSSNDINLVLSYDLPMVTPGLLEYLVSQRRDAEIVLPALELRKPEPLSGLYCRSLSGILDQMIREKEYAVHAILSRARSRIVLIEPSHSFWQRDLFLNINREEDLEKLPNGFGEESDE